jgi:hypothetical protein
MGMALMLGTAGGIAGLQGAPAGAAAGLGKQASSYVPPLSVAKKSVLTWNTAAANSKLLTIIGSYPHPTGNTTRGIQGKTVTFGCIAPNTNNGVATVFQGFCQGVQARLNQANRQKSLPWKLKLTGSADSGSVQDTQNTDIVADVDTTKDFGLFISAALGPIGTNVLESQHVPYFGDFTDCGKNSVFGFDIDYDIETCAALESETSDKWLVYTDSFMKSYVKPLGIPLTAVRYAGLAYDQGTLLQYVHILESQIKASGAKIVGNSTSLPANSSSTVDLGPYVTPLIGDNPSIIGIYSADPTLTARLMGALQQAGYKGNVSAACDASELSNPTVAQEINGCLATSIENGYPSFGGKYWAVLAKEAKSAHQTLNQGFIHGWFEADLAVQGMEAFAKSGKPLTAENLTNLMNNGWTYGGFGDVSAPQTFPYGKYNSSPCTALARESASKKKELPYQDLTCAQVIYAPLS